MADGICVKLAVDVPTICPVAGLSAVEGGEGRESPAIRDVTWTRATDGTVTEEFRVDAAVAADNPEAVPGADPVMEAGRRHSPRPRGVRGQTRDDRVRDLSGRPRVARRGCGRRSGPPPHPG
jgi:hypothetical protein